MDDVRRTDPAGSSFSTPPQDASPGASDDRDTDGASRLDGSPISCAEVLRTLRSGTFPPAALAGFLHGSTHHRCMDSPVGSVLLGIDALARPPRSHPGHCVPDERTASDRCRTSQTRSNRMLARELRDLMDPLFEGLALYGEIDAAPGSSVAASATYLNTRAVFFDGRRTELRRLGLAHLEASEFEAWLARERRRAGGAFERTRALLRNSGAGSPTHPHASGYAWIHALLRDLYARSDEARGDLDVGLAFLCSFFFDDWRLAALVASCARSSTGPAAHTTYDVCAYLRARVDLLRSPQVVLLYDEYVRAVVRGTAGSCSFCNADREIMRRVDSFVEHAMRVERRACIARPLANRHVFRFAAFVLEERALRRSGETLSVRVDGESFRFPLLEADGEAPAAATAMEEHGSIELVLVDFEPLVCCFAGDRLASVTDRDLHTVPVDYAEEQLGMLTSTTHEVRRHGGVNHVCDRSEPADLADVATPERRSTELVAALYT